MKPPFVISTIKWLRYPENKPEKNESWYWALLDNDMKEIAKLYYDDGEFWENSSKAHWESERFINVVAFAELPTVDDSDEFDFTTAVELMKEGLHCKSELGAEYYLDNRTFWKVTKDSQYTDCISSSEITGKWRLVE